jgi:hypothetical protein
MMFLSDGVNWPPHGQSGRLFAGEPHHFGPELIQLYRASAQHVSDAPAPKARSAL